MRESGSALVLHVDEAGAEVPCRVHWRSASVWRVQTRRGTIGSDGTVTWSDKDPPHPTRRGHPPWHLMPVFPLRAPVWGRMGDNYYPSSAVREAHGVRVGLTGTEDDRTGSVLVGAEGFLLDVSFASGTRLQLRELDLRPQPDNLFASP